MKCPRCKSILRKNIVGDIECLICGYFEEITTATVGKYGPGISALVVNDSEIHSTETGRFRRGYAGIIPEGAEDETLE